MKKLFIAILGVAAFAACSQDMTLETPKGAAIGFDNVFVENATRAADYTAGNITDFSVYGFITKDTEGAIFTDQKVAGSNAAGFTYSPAQYWVGGATYSFSALVPYEGRHWEYTATNSGNGVISFNNQTAVANQDLLFAYATRTTPASITAAPEAVAFTFDHVLSRVKFSFVNGFGDGQNITLKVTNVNITNAYANGTLALENGVLAEAWAPADKNLNVAFGDVAGDKLGVNVEGETTHYYLIPAEDTYEVTFTVAIYQSDVLVDTYNRTATVTVALERGKSYDLQATLTAANTSDDGALYPIEFTVGTVNGWENYTGADVTVPEHVVATAAELIAAVEEGGNVLLTDDIDLGEGTRAAKDYGLEIKANTILDGNGYTITCSAVRAINVCASATEVTIKNLNLVAGDERGINVEGADKKLTIENVTAVSNNYTVNLVGSTVNNVVEINNCDLKGLNVVNVWGANSKVTVNNTTLRCEDNASDEGYGVVAVNNMAEGAEVVVNGGEVIITGTACEDTVAGILVANGGASLAFVGTAGNPVVNGQSYLIRYGDYNYTFATWEEAYETAQAGETIVVIKDVTLSNPLLVSKNIAVDLNGHTLTAPVFAESNGAVLEGDSDSYVFWVKEGATLTINGEGTVAAQNAKYSIAVWAQGGNVVINGGTYTNAGEGADLIYASAGGNVVINGGEFVACPKQAGVDGTLNAYSALNVKDADYRSGASDIVVYGGKFFQFNPADNASEGAGTNFCAAGKTVEQDGDWYIVK